MSNPQSLLGVGSDMGGRFFHPLVIKVNIGFDHFYNPSCYGKEDQPLIQHSSGLRSTDPYLHTEGGKKKAKQGKSGLIINLRHHQHDVQIIHCFS